MLATLLLLGCTPTLTERCDSGVRQTWTEQVTIAGNLESVTTTQCVTSGWTEADCDTGPESCRWFFEPHTDPTVPLALVYGDFVFRHAVGDIAVAPPEVAEGTTDLRAALMAVQYEKLPLGYRTTPIQPIQLLGYPTWEMGLSCDHPDIDPICPFTWNYLFVDLNDLRPGMYADFSVQTAEFVDMGDESGVRPVEFDTWWGMVESVTLAIEE